MGKNKEEEVEPQNGKEKKKKYKPGEVVEVEQPSKNFFRNWYDKVEDAVEDVQDVVEGFGQPFRLPTIDLKILVGGMAFQVVITALGAVATAGGTVWTIKHIAYLRQQGRLARLLLPDKQIRSAADQLRISTIPKAYGSEGVYDDAFSSFSGRFGTTGNFKTAMRKTLRLAKAKNAKKVHGGSQKSQGSLKGGASKGGAGQQKQGKAESRQSNSVIRGLNRKSRKRLTQARVFDLHLDRKQGEMEEAGVSIDQAQPIKGAGKYEEEVEAEARKEGAWWEGDRILVPRRELERDFRAAVNAGYASVVFVYGPRGSGKNTLVLRTLGGRSGLLVTVNVLYGSQQIYSKIMTKLGGKIPESTAVAGIGGSASRGDSSGPAGGMAQDRLIQVFQECQRKNFTPLIVVYIDEIASLEALREVMLFARMCVQEERFCKWVFVGLQESLAATLAGLADDFSCRGFCVPDMNPEEALQLADLQLMDMVHHYTNGVAEKVTTEDRRKIADQILKAAGNRPSHIEALCQHVLVESQSKNLRPQHIIQTWQHQMDTSINIQIDQLVRFCLPLTKLLKDIFFKLFQKDSHLLLGDLLMAVERNGDVRDLLKVLQRVQVILVDPFTSRITFHSHGSERVAKQMLAGKNFDVKGKTAEVGGLEDIQ